MDPVRFTPAEVGLHYPASSEVLWDPRDGSPANQYVASVRIYTRQTWMIVALRTLRDLGYPSIATLAISMMRDVVGKFTIDYILRPLQSGQPYFFHANYLWDLPGHVFTALRYHIQNHHVDLSTQPDLAALLALDTGYTPTPHAGGTPSQAGLLRDSMAFTPLTDAQRVLVQDTHDAHAAHVDAIHRRAFDELPALSAAVVNAHKSLESSTTTANDQVLLTLPQFNATIDPHRWNDGTVDDFFEAADVAHATWMSAVLDTDIVESTRQGLRHLRNHALIGLDMPNLIVKTVGDADLNPDSYPATGDPD